MRRRRLRAAVATLVVGAVVIAAAAIGLDKLLQQVSPSAPTCTLGVGAAALDLEPEQAANAATVAAVGKRERLADHAVTIALAAALQESKLFNVDYGDRDSLGIFQQRPSQGWGSPSQLLDPSYAAAAFFAHLAQVSGWQSLPVAEAAQRVQHSADGSAYAQWEEQARELAKALTGESPAALTCKWPGHRAPRASDLQSAAAHELGADWASDGNTGRNWTVAEWLVAHSYEYGVVAVAVDGKRWTNHSGKWSDDSRAGAPSYLLDQVAHS
ncbi:MAG TPA: hypothetical protein VFH54_09880 [Mycobacteriales bacterium]|nr:hypothetical protein [Mycobacteriales bacterium]